MKFLCIISGLIYICATDGFDLFPKDTELYYNYNGTVQIDAFPYDKDVETIEPNTWSINGRLTLQRQDDDYIAALFTPKDVIAEKLPSLENPFKLLLTNGIVTSIQFLKNEPIWAANIKRAIASALQVHGEEPGAFVISEGGLNGFCNMDYYISSKDENGLELTVQKTPELASCFPFVNGVHNIKSNLQPVGCQNKELNIEDNVLVGIESQYILNVRSKDNNEIKYRLTEGTVKSRSSVHTFETNGESHSILSMLNLKYDSEGEIQEKIDLTRDLIPRRTNLDYIAYEYSISAFDDIDMAEKLLNKLVDTLETRNVDFNYPYDDTAAEIFRIVGLLDEKSLVKLYKKFDIGTSYRQETAKNLFLEILPRIGSKASVMLIEDLIVNKYVKPTTAIQLLVTMPFYITDLSMDVVSLCEPFLSLGPDRPDVKDAAVLSYATIIFKTYSAHQMTPNQFDRYVKRYFDLFVDAIDYEQKMLYIQALANLQLGNVAQYLAPIIKDSKQSTDLRYLAMWATMPTAHTRSEQSYEIFWPIFEKKTNPLELRISAFTVLLTSNPSPGRLLSLHRIVTQETSQHLLNFYRSTIISMSESTYPCHTKLKRTLSYMLRYIPKKQPPSRFWVTGNYIVDYKDAYYGNAGLVQAMFIGDEVSDTPYIGFFKFVTEALGRITDHMGIHIKARGVSDSLLNLIVRNVSMDNIHKLRSMLDDMDLNTVMKTPLHMELVLQFEGKTVLAYYLNNTTIRELSGSHIISIFSDDSHINMQTIRWPFMIKHSLPTALGTPIALTIQNTVLNTLRGNVTQIASLSSVSSEIDIRQYTYSALSSSTYNPFVNLEHSIRREQGLIIYLPFHNQIGVDILHQTARLSFSRPADLVSGYSMKSRIISRTEGTHSNGEHFVEERSFFSRTNTTNLIPIQIPFVDLGLDLNIVSNEASLDNLMALYSAIDIQKNIAILDDIQMGQKLLNSISSAHLGSIHFGSDKHFQVVVNNKKASITEFVFKMTDDKVDISMEHKHDFYSEPSYIWNLNVQNIESGKIRNRFRVALKRLDQTNEFSLFPKEFSACAKITHEPLVYYEKPDVIDINFSFGAESVNGDCSNLGSKLDFKITRDISPIVKDIAAVQIWDEGECPHDLLKFSPPPYDEVCTHEDYQMLSTISYYEFDVKYKNLPFEALFEEFRDRVSYIISGLLPDKLELLNLRNKIHLVVHSIPGQDEMEIKINDRTFYAFDILPNLDLVPDLKYETDTKASISLGFIQQCSIINNRLLNFNDEKFNLDNYLSMHHNLCPTLLLADCTENPTLAVYINRYHNNQNLNTTYYSLTVHAGGPYLTILPWLNGSSNVIVTTEKTCHNLIEMGDIEFPSNEYEDPQVKVYLNEGIVIVEHSDVFQTKIQFNGRGIISIQTLRTSKHLLCGLCNDPTNRLSDLPIDEQYTYCDHEVNTLCESTTDF